MTDEQIINKLREAEVLLSQGMALEDFFKQLEISIQTYYRWRKEYGRLDLTRAKGRRHLKKAGAPDSNRQPRATQRR